MYKTIKEIYSKTGRVDLALDEFATQKYNGSHEPRASALSSESFLNSNEKSQLEAINDYKTRLNQFKSDIKEWNKYHNSIRDTCIEFIKKHSSLNQIPEQYRDKLFNYALSQWWRLSEYEYDKNTNHYSSLYYLVEELIDEIFL